MVGDDRAGEDLDLGALLSSLLRTVVEREKPILADHGLTMWEYVILDRLAGADGLTQKELARRSHRDPTRLIAHLDALDGRGMIAREVDQSDRRRRTVILTDRGRDLVRTVRSEIRQMEAALLSGLTANAQNELRASLATVLRRGSPEGSPR